MAICQLADQFRAKRAGPLALWSNDETRVAARNESLSRPGQRLCAPPNKRGLLSSVGQKPSEEHYVRDLRRDESRPHCAGRTRQNNAHLNAEQEKWTLVERRQKWRRPGLAWPGSVRAFCCLRAHWQRERPTLIVTRGARAHKKPPNRRPLPSEPASQPASQLCLSAMAAAETTTTTTTMSTCAAEIVQKCAHSPKPLIRLAARSAARSPDSRTFFSFRLAAPPTSAD